MRPLYELSNEYQSLMSKIMQCEEISKEEIIGIESINDDIKQKAINVAAFIKNLEVESEGIEKAMSAMEDRNIKVNKKIESLREYLKSNLEKCDIKEVRSPFFDIKIKVNPASVIVNDEKLIPGQYFRELIMRKIDKTLISQELRNNILIPGVTLENKTRLEIR